MSVGMIIPNIWKKKKCSKPPTRDSQRVKPKMVKQTSTQQLSLWMPSKHPLAFSVVTSWMQTAVVGNKNLDGLHSATYQHLSLSEHRVP
jgi:phage gp29-like protein